ncbi:MAG: MoaD/ThiS family protein [Actinobacteria bacterium]|nr:MoaD/ThiS family protein [Actinomycetota bacterium]
MIVRFFAGLRDLTHESELTLDTPARDVSELTQILVSRYGEDLRGALVDPDGALRATAVILVNGQNIRLDAELATRLQANDDIAIFPLVAGG